MGTMSDIRGKTKILLWILIVAFVALIVIEWGAQSISSFGFGQQGIIANVGNQEIKVADFYKLFYQEQQNALQRSASNRLDNETLERLHEQTWDRMVEDYLINQFVEKHEIAVSDSEVVFNLKYNPPDFIRTAPAFQTEGKFDFSKYQQAINDPGLAPQWKEVETFMRVTLLRQKLQEMVSSSVRVSETEILEEFGKRFVTARVKFVFFDPYKFGNGQYEVTDEEIAGYYNTHQDEFDIEATARLAYVRFDRSLTAEDSAQVLQKARDIWKKAVEGADFSKLARRESDDPSVVNNDGSLGYFTRGRMVKPFEEAAFSAKVGDIVGPIETSFGYHIIKVEDRKFSGTKDDDGVDQDTVKASHVLLNYQALTEKRTIDAETKASYFAEDAKESSFGAIADREGLQVDSTVEIVRNESGLIPGIKERFPVLMKKIFSNQPGWISKPYMTSTGYLVFTIVSTREAGIQKLSDVRKKIREKLIVEKQKEDALKAAKEVRARIDSIEAAPVLNPNLEVKESNDFTISRSVTGILGLDRSFNTQVFRMTKGDLSEAIAGDKGPYIVKVVDMKPFDEAAYKKQRPALKNQLMSRKVQSAYRDWLENLKKTARIEDFRDQYDL